MLVIKSPSRNAYFNIAAEEYLLKTVKQDVFLIYINDPAIIVGKHQNTMAEINKPFVEANGIKVVRRLSGGGAVYHDDGNLNFSFHMKADEKDDFVDFLKFTKPVVDLLNQMGVRAQFKGRNDLVIDDKKFSGNAKMKFHHKILQHGTILFDSEMKVLSDALKVNPLKFRDKAVKSVRSRVTNIVDYLPEAMNIDVFSEKLINYVIELYPKAVSYEFTDEDIVGIQKLADEKYATWEWNYGSSPEYNFNKGIKTDAGYIEFHLDVTEGMIRKARIFGDFFASKPIHDIEKRLLNQRHDEQTLLLILVSLDLKAYFGDVTAHELINGLI
ncbi:MAG: lipoate--protein ligase [Bacteroidales bacterium]|jgi:lipoate-protein ligase A|nr:lipoate--protein ligase [Bacteroidales bacterium]